MRSEQFIKWWNKLHGFLRDGLLLRFFCFYLKSDLVSLIYLHFQFVTPCLFVTSFRKLCKSFLLPYPRALIPCKINPFPFSNLAWSCLRATMSYKISPTFMPPEDAAPLLGKFGGLQVLFSSSLLSSLAGPRDSRGFLCFCFFSDSLRGARSKQGTVRSGGQKWLLIFWPHSPDVGWVTHKTLPLTHD